jgi:phosphoglycerate kinase
MFTGHYGIDIGPASEVMFCKALGRCKTILWNGPMGKFEVRTVSNLKQV